MVDLDRAVATQLANIEKRTGKSLDELASIIRSSGLSKHGQLVAMLKNDLGMGHGDANTLVHTVMKGAATGSGGAETATGDQMLDELYTGPKAALRPIHERLLEAMRDFGPFEEAPKKAYVSYRRNRQFAMIGPATNTRVEVGMNVKGLSASERLKEQPAGKMCNYTVRLGAPEEVDAELVTWLREAYEAAG